MVDQENKSVKSKKRGLNFCRVERIRQVNQSIEFITWGNQKKQGAIPAFIVRHNKRIRLECAVEGVWGRSEELIINVNKSTPDLTA